MKEILYVSSRIQGLTGWTVAEIYQQHELLDQIIDPADRSLVKAARSLSQGSWSIYYKIKTKDGTIRWLHESAKIVEEHNDHYVVGTLRARDPLLPSQSG
jgi:PAS domain S-box-containing protein